MNKEQRDVGPAGKLQRQCLHISRAMSTACDNDLP